jgi:fatty acid desaturase
MPALWDLDPQGLSIRHRPDRTHVEERPMTTRLLVPATPATTELIQDALRALAVYVVPVGVVTVGLVAAFVWSGHLVAAWLTVVVVFLVGVAVARTAVSPAPPARHGRRRSPTVRRVNRRAAIVLPVAAVALATLMAGIAVRPVLAGLLGIAVLLFLVPGLGALAGYEMLRARRSALARGTQA